MKIARKLVSGYIAISLLVALVGLLGLTAATRTIQSFESRERHLRSIVSAATEASSYAKRAEGHLMLFLLLHQEKDRAKFFSRYVSLQEQIAVLDKKVRIPEARSIVERMKIEAEELLPAGERLIEAHERDLKRTGRFEPEQHKAMIGALSRIASRLREHGIKLAALETDFLNKQEAITAATEVSSTVKGAESHLLLFLMFHDPRDKEEFFHFYRLLQGHMATLNDRVRDAGNRALLERIAAKTSELLPLGTALIKRHDEEMKREGRFSAERHMSLLQQLNETVSAVREDGVRLTKLKVEAEEKSRTAIIKSAEAVQKNILITVAAAFFISLVLGFLISRSISRPIAELRRAAAAIGKGQLDTSIAITAKDEVGELAKSFNDMAAELKSLIARERQAAEELREYQLHLEDIVKERTAALTRANERLQLEVGERKWMMEALRQSEMRFREVAENIDEVFWMSDAAFGEIRYVSPAFEKIWGAPIQRLYEENTVFLGSVHKDDRERVEERILKSGDDGFDEEFRIVRDDGSIRWIRNRAFPVRGESGQVCRLVGVAADITGNKAMLEELKASEERYRCLYNNTPVMLHSIDRNGRLVSVSWYWLASLGYEFDEVIGRTLTEFMTGASRRYAEETVLPGFMRTGHCRDVEYQFVKKSGEVVEVLLSAIAEYDAAGVMVRSLAVLIDVTERKRIEEEKAKLEMQLLQSQKMEAVGRLAGGIAHDFNNILTAIIGFGTILKNRMDGEDGLRFYAEQILDASESAAHLTRELLAFSRKQIINPKPVDLNAVVKKMERILLNIIGEDIEMETATADCPLTVIIDAGQIEQVLLNLASNARDAMPDGGRLFIRTKQAVLDGEYLKAHGQERPGAYACITVTDTGAGMDERTRERLFEPFYTTKEVGKGTGLGLAIVYGIVKQHGGSIDVGSEAGRGTTFTILLPITPGSAEEKEGEAEAAACLAGTETVLLAEDEEMVRTSLKDMLEEHGYRVIEAVDGEDAIDKFIAYADTIELVIADVVMPKKNGKEVYDAITGMRPRTRVLFTSGYTADIIHKKGVLEEDLDFIAKPVPPGELLRKVRAMLDS
ncbi:MAG: PAS domain S-box protein [Nitrospirota bacterium]